MARPFEAGTVEDAADQLLSVAAWEKVTTEPLASTFKNFGEQAEVFKKLRRDNVPKVVTFVEELLK